MSGISILMYHQVGRFPTMKTHRATYCHLDRFRWQMQALKRLGWPVLSMSAALAALAGRAPMPRRAAVLTFDDGYENFREHALPVLEELGFPCIVYAIAGMLGQRAAWLEADGHPAPRLLDGPALRELVSRGVEIGSHAMSHVRLAALAPQDQLYELRTSRERLSELLGAPVVHACYPYGSHSQATLDVAAAAGYASGVTCQRGAATRAFDPLALPRKAVAQGDDLVGFLWKLYAKDSPKGEALRRAARPECLGT